MTKNISTLTGFIAILTWSFLALLSTAAGPIPPFQLAAMSFFLGGMVGVVSWIFRPHALRSLRQPWEVWALGVAGLCIYHCAYFFAIQSAPPVEASLIAYLWPLLIVLFASLLPGEKLRLHHIVGGGTWSRGRDCDHYQRRECGVDGWNTTRPHHCTFLRFHLVWLFGPITTLRTSSS